MVWDARTRRGEPSVTQVDPTLGQGGDPEGPAIAAILDVVRARTGTDFAGYRAATVRRRVMNRVVSAGAQTLEGYLSRLLADPHEVGELVARLTIKVSRFYRNPHHVEAVVAALARLAAAGDRPLRAWSAGCGRGEEAYTLAILLAELGQPSVAGQVIGSDVDPAALGAATAARYPDEALVDLPPRLRARHLQAGGPGEPLVVREGIRARVRLLAHDLTTTPAPPEDGFDLVACRNTLIYFRPEVQARVERVLLRGLRLGGLLWLGEAEWPSRAASRVLRPVDPQARLFRFVGEEGAA